MTETTEKADDDVDALDALESEAKEWTKVSKHTLDNCTFQITDKLLTIQDAEIDRILKAFRLDA